MTTITQKGPITYVNNRIALCGRIDEISKKGNGHWTGTVGNGWYNFELVGGRESGGGSKEWYLRFPLGFGDQWIRYNSAKAAIEAIGKV
jgi:hypothetical protein